MYDVMYARFWGFSILQSLVASSMTSDTIVKSSKKDCKSHAIMKSLFTLQLRYCQRKVAAIQFVLLCGCLEHIMYVNFESSYSSIW